MTVAEAVVWHDVECGGYGADLGLWLSLAREQGGPVLDVGAGTGRVALPLAAAGHDVVALDRDPVLLAALAERADAARFEIETVVADAAAFDLRGRDFALILLPMQTIQLLPGTGARRAFFAAARRALAAGGLVALALADTAETYEDPAELPPPDVAEHDGWRFVSQPLSVRLEPDALRIERLRQRVAPDGTCTTSEDVVRLAAVGAEALAAEAAPEGLRREPSRHVAPTADHVGSEVVLLRG